MLTNRLFARGIILLVTVAVTAGCVSQGKYDQAVKQRDDYRRQVVAMERTENILRGDLKAKGEEMAAMQGTFDDLTTLLSAYIAAKKIKLRAMESGLIIILQEDVLFPTGGAEVKQGGEDVLDGVSKELNEIPFQIVVAGHTDNVPIGASLAKRYPSNWDLAAARASGVARILESDGIAPKRLVVVSFGEQNPIASNDSPDGRAQNRRIELRLRPVVPK